MRLLTNPPGPCQQIFNRLEGEGVLYGLAREILEYSRVDLSAPPRHTRVEIRIRSRGHNRRDDIDDHISHVAERYGFKAHFFSVKRGHPQKVMILERDNLILMIHKTTSPGQVKNGPRYVSEAIKKSVNYLLPVDHTEDEALGELTLDGKTLIQVTYGFNRSNLLKELPDWITFGIPNGDAAGFYFQRPLLTLYPDLLQEYGAIEFNVRPPLHKFSTAPRPKNEGSDI